MKRSVVIGMVWTAVVIVVISFSATLYFLENNNNESKAIANKKDDINDKKIYVTDESSIRTNNLVNVYQNISNQIEKTVEVAGTNVTSFVKPVKGEIIKPLSVDELVFSKTLNEWCIHTGVDYEAKLGDEVKNVRDGKIKDIGFDYKYGDYILIEHNDGYESFYSNITPLDALEKGANVSKGQLLGYVAESFGFEVAEETHLHFELRKEGKYFSI